MKESQKSKVKSQKYNLKLKISKFFSFALLFIFYCLIFASPSLAIYEEKQTPPQSPFVPNQIIVKYKTGQTPADIQSEVETRSARAQSFFGILQNAAENVRLGLSGQSTPEEKLNRIETTNNQAGVVEEEKLFTSNVLGAESSNEQLSSSTSGFYLYSTGGGKAVDEMVQMYSALPEIEFAEPNYIIHALEMPNDTFYNANNPAMWNLTKIEMPQAWDQTKGSNQVIVAVIDTGADLNHEDLKDNLIQGKNFLNTNKSPQDDNGHGTHVSGTIGAVTNNALGVAGINWKVKIMPLKILDASGNGSLSDITKAVSHSVNNNVRIINMSLGSKDPRSCSSTEQTAINLAKNNNIAVVVAAGNKGANAGNYPLANCNGVIAVGATGPNDERAYYSNFGSAVDLAAPGGNKAGGSQACIAENDLARCILSTVLNNQYLPIQGTSMAAPHVAGVAALLLAKKSSLTADQIEQILKDNADTISTDKPIGKRLNANKALLAVSDGATPTTTPSPTGPTQTPTPTTTPGGPTKTPTPSVTPGGPTNTPTPSITPGGPTLTPTSAPSPTITPSGNSPTPIPPTPTPTHSCPQKAQNGDYDCNGVVNEADFTKWKVDFLAGQTNFSFFEYWRRTYYGRGEPLSPSLRPTTTDYKTLIDTNPN